jgi:predicted transcriptional regulator
MEIYMDIIKAVADGREKPTHVMYRANLSWIRLNRYLDFLVKQGFLRENLADGGTTFAITQKGKDVLVYYRRIEGELSVKKRAIPNEVYAHYK